MTHGNEQTSNGSTARADGLTFSVRYGKTTIPLEGFQPTQTILELKEKVREHTGVEVKTMKLIFKGLLKDDDRIQDTKLVNNAKVTVMGKK